MQDSNTSSGARRTSGFGPNSRILTPDGERSLADLRPGDRIVTRDAGTRRLRALAQTFHGALRPCLIGPHALGRARPGRPILLAPDQALLLRDWRARALYGQGTAMVAVRRLVDGTHIRRMDTTMALHLYWPDLGGDHVIYVDGLEFGVQGAPAQLSTAGGDNSPCTV